MDFIRSLADPAHVAKFQRFCGVTFEKPVTCDQQTQTRNQSSSDSDGSSEQEDKAPKSLANHKNCNGHVSNGEIMRGPDAVNIDFSSQQHGHGNVGSGDDSKEQMQTKTELGVESNNNINKDLNSNSNLNRQETDKVRNRNKKSKSKKALHTIEPSSRVHSKGSIFDCNNGHANGDISTNNSDAFSDNGSLEAPPPTPAYHIKYKSLLYLAHFGAFLGNEGFYLTFFPFCIWNLDFLMVRQVAMLWCAVMYIGQATKDYLRWPRPPCPPVVRLEAHYLQEYSMPSTHAMAGTAIPLYMAYLVVERYQVPVVVAATIALLWFSITCMSRLYLGVHTILDLIAGFLYAILIFFTFLRYVEDYDLYQQTHPFAGPVLLMTALALCTVCYPSSHKNSSKGDAVQIVAATTGCFGGGWLGYQLGIMHKPEILQPYTIMVPTLSWCGLALLRFISGTIIIFGFHTVIRLATIRFYSYMYGLDKPDKDFPSVKTAYKFTTYVLVGICISLFVPLLHQMLGIHRPAMFYEVL